MHQSTSLTSLTKKYMQITSEFQTLEVSLISSTHVRHMVISKSEISRVTFMIKNTYKKIFK